MGDRFTARLAAAVCLAAALGAAFAMVYFSRESGLVPLLAGANIILLLRIGTFLFPRKGPPTAGDESKLLDRLEESEGRYRTLAENFLSPIVIFDDSRILFANELFHSLTEYTPEDLLGGNFDVFSLIHEDDRSDAMASIAALLSDDKIREPLEIRFVKKSGEIGSGLTFSSPVQFEGKPAVETVVVDITHMKEMESELNATRKRLQYLLDNAPVMIFNLDRNGKFSYANKETRRVTGYELEEWDGQSFAPIVHPDDLPIAIQKLEEGRRGGKRRDFKLRIRNADDEERRLQISAQTILENGEYVGSLVIAQDTTEQDNLKARLERDKNFIDRLIESANAMIGVVDEHWRFIIFNQRFEEVTGFTKDEALGKTAFELYVPEESRELVIEKVKEVLDGSPAQHTEIPIVSKNGDPLIVTWSGARVNLPSGEKGIAIVGQDVTEHRRMQEELAQSKKLASIGELVSGVAHELNNPLTVVMGYSQMLSADRDISARHADMAQKVFDGALRSKKIVENLLAFARNKKLEKHEINLNELIEEMLKLREHSFAVNNIKIVRNYDPAIPTTCGDGHQLQQVFLNLINNAFDSMYGANRGGTLSVKTYQNNGSVVMEIVDNGPGVPESIQEKIFDPFFTTKEVGKGTGLGMSLSYGIMREHGGRIYLDKAYRRGARFVVEIPLTETPTTSADN